MQVSSLDADLPKKVPRWLLDLCSICYHNSGGYIVKIMRLELSTVVDSICTKAHDPLPLPTNFQHGAQQDDTCHYVQYNGSGVATI